MHVLIILIIVIVLLYLYFNGSTSGQSNERSSSEIHPIDVGSAGIIDGPRLAFISRGKLFYKDGNTDLKELHSPYVQGVMDRMERAQQRQGWKKGTAFETSYVGNRSNVPSDQLDIRATTAQFTPEGTMLYFLRDENVGGLFEYDFETGGEKRLIHQQKLLLTDMSLDQAGQRLICAQQSASGTANIGLLDTDGSNYREITGGDTVDSAPAWIPSERQKIVFQSSGIARNEDGYVVALGPASIQMLDLENGELTAIVDDNSFDFIQPKVSPTGELNFIRRPYEPPRYLGTNFLMDFLLFPFRLLRAIFHYLNFFSLMYTRKPLTSAAGPEVQADLKEMLVKGKRIDAEKALRKENRINGVPSLVPRTWQLIRRSRDGSEQVVATNVAAYDITADGTIIYTNGYGVFMSDGSNGTRVILREKLVAELIAR